MVTLREQILADLSDRRGIPSDIERGDDWEDARTRLDAMIAAHVAAERKQERARVVAWLRDVTAQGPVHRSTVAIAAAIERGDHEPKESGDG